MLKGRTEVAFSLLRDVYGLSGEAINNLDPAILVQRIRQIHKGLSVEHEFAAIASWLGKCSLLSQIDDVLFPSDDYRVPDFLVVVSHEGRKIPCLVEVKSGGEDSLEWSAKYIQSLRAFADLMKLPLLVAWKRHGLWVLADSNLFVRRIAAYHLKFDDAVKSSLMSMLFGNVWITFAAEFRLELKLRLMDNIDVAADLLPEGSYNFQVEEASVWTRKGRLNAREEKELWWFLVTAAQDGRLDRVSGETKQKFVANSDSVFNLSDVLLAQLFWNKGSEEPLDWLAEIRRGLPHPATDLISLLDRALDAGAVQYVFRQSPQVLPEFLR